MQAHCTVVSGAVSHPHGSKMSSADAGSKPSCRTSSLGVPLSLNGEFLGDDFSHFQIHWGG